MLKNSPELERKSKELGINIVKLFNVVQAFVMIIVIGIILYSVYSNQALDDVVKIGATVICGGVVIYTIVESIIFNFFKKKKK